MSDLSEERVSAKRLAGEFSLVSSVSITSGLKIISGKFESPQTRIPDNFDVKSDFASVIEDIILSSGSCIWGL